MSCEKTTYIVSGYMRCGTSAMMQALIAGGMDASYSKTRAEKMNEKWGEPDKVHGYQPNGEYYELDPMDYSALDFPQDHEGKLIKCLWKGAAMINNGQYRCVFMRRPRVEIERSLTAFFGQPTAAIAHPYFDASIDKLVQTIRDRRSFLSVDEVFYGDMVADPLPVFERLARNGWPIDPAKAAQVPSRAKMRQAA